MRAAAHLSQAPGRDSDKHKVPEQDLYSFADENSSANRLRVVIWQHKHVVVTAHSLVYHCRPHTSAWPSIYLPDHPFTTTLFHIQFPFPSNYNSYRGTRQCQGHSSVSCNDANSITLFIAIPRVRLRRRRGEWRLTSGRGPPIARGLLRFARHYAG